MKAQYWSELIVGTIILGTLGFLAFKVIDTSEKVGTVDGKIGTVDTKVTFTSQRVDRIANALPDMRVNIAQEEIKRPIKTAVISTKPIETAEGKWHVIVNVVDAESSTKWTFLVDLASKDDRKPLYTLIGSAADAEPSFVSVAQLEKFVAVSKSEAAVPHYIDAQASFVMHDTDAKEYLNKILWLSQTAKKSNVQGLTNDWTKLAATLDENADAFKKW
jgi:hypothetical protein